MTANRNERGQAMVLTVLFITALLGISALVLDVGSWYRQHRALQATADAAALAGAQKLPYNAGDARGTAAEYANKNLSGLTDNSSQVSSTITQDDVIKVHVAKPAPGFFAKIFGIDSVNEGATATARTEGMAQAKYVAPVVVKSTHEMLNGCGGPCFGPGYETQIPVDQTGAPGAFALVNLNQGQTSGTQGASVLANWIENGYQDYLPLGAYFSDPGVKFNSNGIQDAFRARMAINPVLLFPVYDNLTGQGSNAQYHIIGWAAFHVDAVDKNGNNGHITGYFTQVIWTGLQATSPGGGGPAYGARAVQLID